MRHFTFFITLWLTAGMLVACRSSPLTNQQEEATTTAVPASTSGPTVTLAPSPAMADLAYKDPFLTNLVTFARLYGLIRHFHPSDAAEEMDWDQVAVNGVQAVQGAAAPTELETRKKRGQNEPESR